MSVYSKSASLQFQAEPINAINRGNRTTRAKWSLFTHGLNYNFILLGFSVLLILSYVFLANYLVSQNYTTDILKKQLSQAEANNQISDNNRGLDQLMTYAQNKGMIESKDADSIFEDTGVALK